MDKTPSSRRLTTRLIYAATILQVICLVLFVGDFVISLTGIATINWQLHELIEIGVAVGLMIGTGIGVFALRRATLRSQYIEGQLRAASGAFSELLADKFEDWRLTPAERDVALFSIKGVPLAEIATLRGVSEGTIKAQTNAIYRKAGVTGRSQLLGLFIEDLIEGPMPDVAPTIPETSKQANAGR